jgi:hypothetical protein
LQLVYQFWPALQANSAHFPRQSQASSTDSRDHDELVDSSQTNRQATDKIRQEIRSGKRPCSK